MKACEIRLRALVRTGLVLAVVVATTGCQDPKYKTKQAIRDGRMEEFFEDLQALEVKRPKRLQHHADLQEELRARYAERLDETLKKIEGAYLKDKTDWMKYGPIRHERIRSVWDGKPQEIPGAVQDMIY